MNQKQIQRAIIAALTDDATLSKIADVASKKIMDEKAKVSTIEDELVKRHIVFSATKGDYLTASEVASKLADEFEINEEISARRLGKSLLRDAEDVKNTSSGRAYLIEAFVKDVKNHVPEEVEEDQEEDKDNVEEIEVTRDIAEVAINEITKGGRHPDTVVALGEEEIEEITQIDVEQTPTSKSDITVTNEVAELISNEFPTIQKYEDHLTSLKFKKLVKHVEKYGYNLDTEELEKEEIIHEIIDCYENEFGLLFEVEDVFDKQDLKDLKPTKKDKKKGKKDKKKKNKNKD